MTDITRVTVSTDVLRHTNLDRDMVQIKTFRVVGDETSGNRLLKLYAYSASKWYAFEVTVYSLSASYDAAVSTLRFRLPDRLKHLKIDRFVLGIDNGTGIYLTHEYTPGVGFPITQEKMMEIYLTAEDLS
jgi:hypothetical protein